MEKVFPYEGVAGGREALLYDSWYLSTDIDSNLETEIIEKLVMYCKKRRKLHGADGYRFFDVRKEPFRLTFVLVKKREMRNGRKRHHHAL